MDFAALVLQCTPPNVSAYTMYQIATVESAHRAHAIGYKLIRRVKVLENGKEKTIKIVSTLTTQPKDPSAAVEWVRYLQSEGYEFDAGAGQIHSTNFAPHGLTAESVFDPCANIHVGAKILTDCYQRAQRAYRNPQDALKAAISCYQSGDFITGFGTGYVNKVLSVRVPQVIAERQ